MTSGFRLITDSRDHGGNVRKVGKQICCTATTEQLTDDVVAIEGDDRFMPDLIKNGEVFSMAEFLLNPIGLDQ